MTTTRRAAVVAALLLIVAAAGFLFLLRGSDTPVDFLTTTTATTTGTDTTATTTAVPTGTVTEPDQPATTTGTVTATTLADPTGTVTETDEPATTTGVTVPTPSEPDEWWTYNPELEWPVTDRDRLAIEAVYPSGMIEDAVQVAQQVEAFWAWYMTWGHPQGATLDLHQPDHREWLAGDAVGQLMYIHHRFWQQRLPVWRDVWNREFELERFQQRNKLIYLDSLGALSKEIGVSGGSIRPSSLLYNPADETSVWRYWGPIIRPVPDLTAPRRSGELILPDDIRGACGPHSGERLALLDWECVHLGPADGTALGDWDVGWYYDIPHEHAAWYVYAPESGLVRYDPDVHGAPACPKKSRQAATQTDSCCRA